MRGDNNCKDNDRILLKQQLRGGKTADWLEEDPDGRRMEHVVIPSRGGDEAHGLISTLRER